MLFLGAFGTALGFLVWRLSTMKTDPEGYVRLTTVSGSVEAWRARLALERAHIPVIVDSHIGMVRGGTAALLTYWYRSVKPKRQ